MSIERYDLFIDLDFQKPKYLGTLHVKLNTEQNVVFDSVGLNMNHVSSGDHNLRFDQTKDQLVIETGPFDGTLQIEYEGFVPDSLAGIYRAPYENTHIVTTHFEAAQARRMLPCVDRPDAKAEFKLAVRIDNDLQAISNMPIESQKADGNKKIITFQRTPRMSTYLLYLGVGKFLEHTTKLGNTNIILATTPAKTKQTAFAQTETESSLEFFNSYYKIPYSLPKIHLIAVPEFAQGAMENWGAITFREIVLLVDEHTSVKSKMRVAVAIAHEIAHQWFGDLVTMRWWDDIWLNESFATFMAYKAVDRGHPEWRIWTNFFNGQPKVETLVGAMSRDSLKSTHAIQVHVSSPDEIEQVFDAISYGKGAHVLQMIEAYVGEQAFREGVRRYLTAHSYSNATSNDLWAAIEDASGKNVKKIMLSWTSQPGFPVVTVSRKNGRLTLKQERLLIAGDSEKVTWPIPVILEANGERRSILMDSEQIDVEVGDLTSLRVNPDRTGFYVTHYKGIEDLVWRCNLSPYDRLGILFDALLFLLSGRLTFDEYLAVMQRFENESDTLPAQEVSDQLALLYSLAPSGILETAKRINRSILNTLRGRTDESSLILTGTVASRLVMVDPEYAAGLADDFKDYGRISPDMRMAVARGYARSTNDLEGLERLYRESNSDEDKVNYLDAITAFANETLVKQALDFAISGEVKRQDIVRVLLRTLDNPQAREIAWRWLQSNIEKLQETYQSTGILSEAFMAIIPILCIGKVREAEDFFSKHVIPDAEMGIKAGLEKLHAYAQLAKTITSQ